MNFTEVCTEVLNIVKRPDKLLDIRREVNSAINQFTMDQEFDRDIVEISPLIDAAQYTQALPLTAFTRFRKFHYIKRGGTRCFLKRLGKNDVSSCDMKDKYYIAGPNVNLSLAALAATVDIAYFQAPPILTDVAPDFWMLELSPYMVIDRAAGKIFTSIGDDASATKHERFAVSAFLSAIKDYGVSTQ